MASGASASKSGIVTIAYYLSYFSQGDYGELVNKAAARATDGTGNIPPAVTRLLASTGYTDLIAGEYPVTLTYSLPGKNQVTSQKQITIRF
jgi:hypothetical protein